MRVFLEDYIGHSWIQVERKIESAQTDRWWFVSVTFRCRICRVVTVTWDSRPQPQWTRLSLRISWMMRSRSGSTGWNRETVWCEDWGSWSTCTECCAPVQELCLAIRTSSNPWVILPFSFSPYFGFFDVFATSVLSLLVNLASKNLLLCNWFVSLLSHQICLMLLWVALSTAFSSSTWTPPTSSTAAVASALVLCLPWCRHVMSCVANLKRKETHLTHFLRNKASLVLSEMNWFERTLKW